MKKSAFCSFALAATICLGVLSGCGGNTAGDSSGKNTGSSTLQGSSGEYEYPKMTLKLGTQEPDVEDNQYQRFAEYFKEYVEEATGGNVEIDIYPNGLLANEAGMLDGFALGTAAPTDLGIFTGTGYGDWYKPFDVCALPFLFPNRDVAREFYDSDFVRKIVDKASEQTNVVILGWGEGGFRNVLNNIRPIHNPEDLADIKLRVPETAIFMNTFKALGGNPTPMAYSETFTGLQQKTIDGIEVPIANAYTMRYQEVCKYMSTTSHLYNALYVGMNKTVYDTLDPQLQELLRECAVKAGNDQRKFTEENEARQLAEMQAAGLEYNDDVNLEAFRALVTPIYEEYRDNVDAELYEEAMALIDSLS